tara:strand:- start:9598 stop:10065 length:468 start_codon:yes stop_codon:yes gene_type:complete
MIDLKQKLDGVVKPKHIARIEQALQSHINPVVGVDAHIATSIVKGLLMQNRRNLRGKKTGEMSLGYCTLYREKRKGQQFIGGRQIKFYAVSFKRANKLVPRINAVFEALGINATVELDEGDMDYFQPCSLKVYKADPAQESMQGITPSLLEILSK